MTPLFSTAYFPPIAYVAAIMRYPLAYIEAKETFPKQTYRNRTVIITAGGIRTLSVPVIRTNHSRTDEVLIDYKERWNVIHLRTLDAAYNASPFFLYYRDGIEAVLMQHHTHLIDLNQAILTWILRQLKSDCRTTLTLDFVPPVGNNDDFRYLFSPKIPYPTEQYPHYCQVFSDRQPFVPNLSILDLLFNLGPETKDYLVTLQR